MFATLQASSLTAKDLKVGLYKKESKLHLTLTNICKSNVSSKDHKVIVDTVDQVIILGQETERILEATVQVRGS